MDEKLKVRRSPKRGIYNLEEIKSILNKDYLCHVAFVHDGYPVNIPTLYGLDGDHIYFHGATTSRMIKDIEKGN